MSSNGSFSEHIEQVCTKARNMCSWILRTFHDRSPILMITLWKSLVQPILDYCSQLWNPTQSRLLKQLEEVQKSFTRKIKLKTHLNYWERLHHLHMYSQERRRERYRIIYMWKVMENVVPATNEGNGGRKLHHRNGRSFEIKISNSQIPKSVQNIRDSSLNVNGAKLFNALPKYLRNCTNCAVIDFKKKLDNFLKNIPDEPVIGSYRRNLSAKDNSLLTLIPLCR